MEPSQIVLIVLVVIMVLVLIVVPMFTNKKRQKSVNDLHSSIQVGDIIMTVGGIKGKVVDVREISPLEKNIIVETGLEESKSTMVFDLTAVYQVLSKGNAPAVDAANPFEEVKSDDSVETNVEAAVEEVKEEEAATKVEEPKTEEVVETKTEEPVEVKEEAATKVEKPKTTTTKTAAAKKTTSASKAKK